jgi:hypothetical protein
MKWAKALMPHSAPMKTLGTEMKNRLRSELSYCVKVTDDGGHSDSPVVQIYDKGGGGRIGRVAPRFT